MSKTILVLLDGCGYEAATENLGYPEHLVEHRLGAKYLVQGELPSLSRPMYETVLTGLPAHVHGICSNLDARRSGEESVFHLCVKHGLTAAAAAYHWISELYCSAPFDPASDRIRLGGEGLIANGIFYFEDTYPDSHVFADAEYLRRTYDPNFLLVHPMNIDDAGHKYGASSFEYHAAAAKANALLSTCLPLWRKLGYSVVVTADHGMNERRLHGGNAAIQRAVALYVFGENVRPGSFCDRAVSQLAVAPLLCALLAIEPSQGMKRIGDMGVTFFEQ